MRCLLLQVLIFDLDCHEQLDSLMVLVLVSRHEGGLLGNRIRRPLGLLCLGSTTLCIVALFLLEALVGVGSIVVFQIKPVCSAVLLGNFPLFVHIGEVTGQLNL